jgi:hypothetical protein
MNHDCSAGPHTAAARSLLICCAGVRDVELQVEPAVCILCVDHVAAFGSLVIAFSRLGPTGTDPRATLYVLRTLSPFNSVMLQADIKITTIL